MIEKNIIKVGMADLNIAEEPYVLTTLGLGSCVGVALYDPLIKLGGLAHIMLPDSTQINNNQNKAKFADTAIELLTQKMIERGATHLVAKIAGGAHMFHFQTTERQTYIGTRNVEAVIKCLAKKRIPVLAQDTGNNYGRSIELHTQTGVLVIKTIEHGRKEI